MLTAFAGADVLSRFWPYVVCAMLFRWELSFALCWGVGLIVWDCWHLFDAIFSQLRKFWGRFCGLIKGLTAVCADCADGAVGCSGRMSVALPVFFNPPVSFSFSLFSFVFVCSCVVSPWAGVGEGVCLVAQVVSLLRCPFLHLILWGARSVSWCFTC